jgi:four helix bundle protein
MPLTIEDARVLQAAEVIADNIWKRVARWGPFARDTVGQHLVEGVDSIGAMVAQAYGRIDPAGVLACLYGARGGLFETKYWLNRARSRELLEAEAAEAYANELGELARQLNGLLTATRQQRAAEAKAPRAVRDISTDYAAPDDLSMPLFSPDDLAWLSRS